MPTTYAIPNGRTVMDATLYTGNGYPTSGTQTITNAASFKPDFIWIKSRSAAETHSLTDSVRGITKQLFSNLTNSEQTDSNQITSINSNGFSLGDNTTGSGGVNVSGTTYVGWQWQAGQGTTSSNTNGSITSTVSVNATAGFSIVTYTGTGANATVGHGLGVAPSMIITKVRSTTNGWVSWHTSLGGADKYIVLSNTNGTQTDSTVWNNTLPTSSVFSIGASVNTNISSATYVAYCWAEVAGFSKFGSYTGNGSTDGPFIYTGFRPKFIMVKPTSFAGAWLMHDTSRDPYNVSDLELQADSSGAEYNTNSAGAGDRFDILSNGFKNRSSNGGANQSGATYIYAAFAENPFKYANAR